MITLNGSTSEALNQGMNLGGSIELPYKTMIWWVINGNESLRSLKNAQYFGGWAAKATNIEEVARDYGFEIPWEREELSTQDAKVIPAYITRSLFCAPICLRSSWLTDGGSRYQKFEQGSRQHVQSVVYLAYKPKEKPIKPLGPALLSAKGYQAKKLTETFKAWARYTAPGRARIAPNVPAWCFYLAIGTFGAQPVRENVGKGNQTRPITPISLYTPENELSDDTLASLFVGNDVADEMAGYLADSQTWLNAWSDHDNPQQQGRNQSAGVYDEMPEPPPDPPYGDDIPF
jgi:hypothetical protein